MTVRKGKGGHMLPSRCQAHVSATASQGIWLMWKVVRLLDSYLEGCEFKSHHGTPSCHFWALSKALTPLLLCCINEISVSCSGWEHLPNAKWIKLYMPSSAYMSLILLWLTVKRWFLIPATQFYSLGSWPLMAVAFLRDLSIHPSSEKRLLYSYTTLCLVKWHFHNKKALQH